MLRQVAFFIVFHDETLFLCRFSAAYGVGGTSADYGSDSQLANE